MSPTAKVSRWFELQPATSASLSRPESGFVSAAPSSDLAMADAALGDGALGDVGQMVASFSTLPNKKRKKLLKLRLGRNVTF